MRNLSFIGTRILSGKGVAIIFSALRRKLRQVEPDFSGWAKPSAVMVLVAEQPSPAVLLIERPDFLSHHAGQIACPGGSFDARFDQSLWDAACRETREEVGIRVSREDFAGLLDPVHIERTGFTLASLVTVITHRPVVRPDPGEVADYQWVTFNELTTVRRMSRVMASGVSYRTPEFPLAWGRLWGATARLLDQLLSYVD